MQKTELVLDIDQTLAGGVVPVHMAYYNRELRLGMSEEAVAATDAFTKTFDVPQIIKFRARDETRFQEVRAEIRTSDEIHLGLHDLPGSVEGVQALIDIAEPSYYTVRPPKVEGATKEWLAAKGFPNPDSVVICATPEDKLRRIIDDKLVPHAEKDELPRVILIDDSYKDLATAADVIVTGDPRMRRFMENIVLVGFGLQSPTAQMEGAFYPQSGLRTLALPNWQRESVQHLKQAIQS